MIGKEKTDIPITMKKLFPILLLCLISSCKSHEALTTQSNDAAPVYIVNGIIFENNEQWNSILCALKPEHIEDITVLKGKEVQKYNPHLKQYGAILVTLKSKATMLKEENIQKMEKLLKPTNTKLEEVRFYIKEETRSSSLWKAIDKEKALQTHIDELSLEKGEDGILNVYIKPTIFIR